MVYFLSDIHLGSKALPDYRTHQDKIVALLETLSQDATAIYLMGDIFDFWFEYFWPTRSKQHRFGPFLNELRSLTDRGIEVHFFTGNHDIWTFGYLAKRTGVIVHRKPSTIHHLQSTLFLAHGDEYCWENHYQWLRRFFHCRVAQFFFRLVPPFIGDAIGFSWAAKSRRREMVEPTEYKGETNESLVQFAKEYSKTHEVNYFIFGHRHIELDLQISSHTRVVIIGDLFRQGTYAALDENGQLTLLNYKL